MARAPPPKAQAQHLLASGHGAHGLAWGRPPRERTGGSSSKGRSAPARVGRGRTPLGRLPQRGHRDGAVHGRLLPRVRRLRRRQRLPDSLRGRPAHRRQRPAAEDLGLRLVQRALRLRRLVLEHRRRRALRAARLPLLRVRQLVALLGLLVQRRDVAGAAEADWRPADRRGQLAGACHLAELRRGRLRDGADLGHRRALRGRRLGGPRVLRLAGAGGLQEGVGVLVAQVLLHSEVDLLGLGLLRQLLAHVDAHAELVAAVHVEDLGRRLDHARHALHRADLLLDLLDALGTDAVPAEVQGPQVRQREDELQQQVYAVLVEAVVDEADHVDLVIRLVALEEEVQLLQLPRAEAEAVEVQVGRLLALDEVHHVPQQRPRLEGLEHLRAREERHVPLAHGGDQAVGLREVAQALVGALLALVQHGQQLGDLLDHRRHRVPRLLRLVEELVDLQLLQQVRVRRLDEDGPLPAGLVEHVLALDVLELLLVLLPVVDVVGDLLLQLVDLVTQLGVVGGQVLRAVRHALDVRLDGVLLLLLPVDAAREVGVLRLERAHAVVHLLDVLLGLILRLLRGGHGLLELLILLLQHDRLLLSFLTLLLREHLRVALHRDLRLEVLRRPLQRDDLLVPGAVLRLLLLELDLIQAQGVHEGVDLVGRVATPLGRRAVLVLQLLVGALGGAQRLLQRVRLDLHRLDGHLQLAPHALERGAPLLVALELPAQLVDVVPDRVDLVLERLGLGLQLLLLGFLLVDPGHVLEVLLLDDLQGLAQRLDFHPRLRLGVLDVGAKHLVLAALGFDMRDGLGASGLGLLHLLLERGLRAVELLGYSLQLLVLAIQLPDLLLVILGLVLLCL
mmetsp:Transcript_96184/g.248719  ORF Transcript_96184/g.248719 Transcript_96184/m.248719 type:complete len:848 (+) Transcript_96184:134-2677(+)